MKVVFTLVLILLMTRSIAIASGHEDQYKCSTEFGQTVPIRMTVTEDGHSKTTDWNPDVEHLTTFSSQVKKRPLSFEKKNILLETRYATREGPNFSFKMNCKKGGCDGQLAAPKIRLDTEVFDKRPESRAGWAEIQFTRRSNLNMLVRVFRESPALSGSGELKFLQRQNRYLLDVGVDEQIELVKGYKTRLAALEIKIDCQRTTDKKD
jgi:hypothetical protein